MAGAAHATGGVQVDTTTGNLNVSGLPLLNEDVDVIVHVSCSSKVLKVEIRSKAVNVACAGLNRSATTTPLLLGRRAELSSICLLNLMAVFLFPALLLRETIWRIWNIAGHFLTLFVFVICFAVCSFALPVAQTKLRFQEIGP